MLWAIGDRRRWLVLAGYLCVFACGAAVVLLLSRSYTCTAGLTLLNPDLPCLDERKARSELDYDPLRAQLIQTIDQYNKSGTVPHIALFFRDLKYGPRFGIRANWNFDPASLLKLPILMVILHEAEHHPALLDEKLTYEKDYGKDYVLGEPDSTITLHASYSIRDLLQKMVEFSDNRSTYMLLDKINELGLRENSNTFSDLGTMQLLVSGQLDNVRLISLVNIFVALYNGNYLSRESSQFALDLLAHTTFNDGLVAGVPKGTAVAHKFGIRQGATAKEGELHDCGIVYHPSHPYVLCILTAGADADAASAAIGNLSKMVYDNVDALRPGSGQ